ncbi:MAG TPA: hypothetical protein DIU37_04465 [Opitutae bacterium]|nr:hypothetical protein [Opitutae bacterium]|tara:strand:+ start:1848 stop:2528 length:681 start_codon:yes stop_codon:yes gene_type:complete
MAYLSPSPRRTGEDPNACWGRIGVWGSGSCEDLETFVHCFNCPIYRHSGKVLLERSHPEAYLESVKDNLKIEAQDRSFKQETFLVFKLGQCLLGILSDSVRAVLPIEKIHRVPFRTNHLLLGLVPVRGNLRLAYSLQSLLFKEKKQSEDHKDSWRRMLLVGSPNLSLVFPVEDVLGLVSVDGKDVKPYASSAADARWMRGMTSNEDDTLLLLNEEVLIPTLQGLRV